MGSKGKRWFLAVVLGSLLGAFGAEAFLHPLRRDAVFVLCLHRIAPVSGDQDDLALSPERFEALLDDLQARGVPLLSLEEFRQWRAGERTIPRVAALLTFDDGYEDNATALLPILRRRHVPAAVFVVGANVGTPGRLSENQMREMAQSGLVAFGSHTQHHRNLRGLSASQLTEEFAGSRERLEQVLGTSVDVLAYPNGRNGPAIRRMAAKSGYALAFGTAKEPCTRDSDPRNLPRHTPGTFSRALQWRLFLQRLVP